MLEKRTISEVRGGEADRKRNKMLSQGVWLSLMSYSCEQRISRDPIWGLCYSTSTCSL